MRQNAHVAPYMEGQHSDSSLGKRGGKREAIPLSRGFKIGKENKTVELSTKRNGAPSLELRGQGWEPRLLSVNQVDKPPVFQQN